MATERRAGPGAVSFSAQIATLSADLRASRAQVAELEALVAKLRAENSRLAVQHGEQQRIGYDKGWAEGRAYEAQMQGRPRAEAAEREAATLREALADLHGAFSSMPDAGLTNDDPRYAWWFETFDARDRARAALAGAGRSTGDDDA